SRSMPRRSSIPPRPSSIKAKFSGSDGAELGKKHPFHPNAYMHTPKGERAMHKRMTISIDEDVYDGLVRVVGRRKISQFLENLARPHVVGESLESAYAAMAADK